MIEVHLIGYTEDGSELVFDLDPEGEGRYALTVDPDLFATLEAVREARVAHGQPVDARRVVAGRRASGAAGGNAPSRHDTGPPGVVVQIRADGETSAGPTGQTGRVEPEAAGDVEPEAAGDVEPEAAVDLEPEPAEQVEPEVAPTSVNGSSAGSRATLSPAEIQRRLRSGKSVGAVAQEAGVEPAWIERWLPPIVAERERVLADAWQRSVGEGTEPLRPQVEEALARRGAPADRTVWSTARRADGRWRVSVRFPEDGRSRSATWTLRTEGGPLSPASPLATELYTAAGRRRRR